MIYIFQLLKLRHIYYIFVYFIYNYVNNVIYIQIYIHIYIFLSFNKQNIRTMITYQPLCTVEFPTEIANIVLWIQFIPQTK